MSHGPDIQISPIIPGSWVNKLWILQFEIVRSKNKDNLILTPMAPTVLSKDVNKICFDDYAHTVHW